MNFFRQMSELSYLYLLLTLRQDYKTPFMNEPDLITISEH